QDDAPIGWQSGRRTPRECEIEIETDFYSNEISTGWQQQGKNLQIEANIAKAVTNHNKSRDAKVLGAITPAYRAFPRDDSAIFGGKQRQSPGGNLKVRRRHGMFPVCLLRLRLNGIHTICQ